MIHLYVGDDVTAYDFYIRRRLNFIRGDSGTGKTSFVDLLSTKINQSSSDIELHFEGVSGVLVATPATLESLMKDENSVGRLVVLDEAFQLLESDFAGLIAQYCLKRDLYFLIMLRPELGILKGTDVGKKLSYSINAVYVLENKSGLYTLSPRYSYPSASLYDVDKILVEDSGKAYKFFNHFFGDKVISASDGKSSISTDVQSLINSGHSSILVLFDTAAFGCHMERFDKLFSRCRCNIIVSTCYECFEYLLCMSNLLKSDLDSELKELDACANSCVSWETYFKAFLSRVTHGKFYRYAAKGGLSKCYLESCDSCNNYIRLKCDRNLIGDKFKSLFEGTDFDWLLKVK